MTSLTIYDKDPKEFPGYNAMSTSAKIHFSNCTDAICHHLDVLPVTSETTFVFSIKISTYNNAYKDYGPFTLRMVCTPATTVFVMDNYNTSSNFIENYNYTLMLDGLVDSELYPSHIYLPDIPCTLNCCSNVTFAAYANDSATPLGSDLVKSVMRVPDSADPDKFVLLVEINVNIESWTSTEWAINATNKFHIVASVTHGNYT